MAVAVHRRDETSPCRGPAGCARIVTEVLHALGGGHPEHCEPVRQSLPGCGAQPQTRDVQRLNRLVASREYPAGVVEPVVSRRQVLEVASNSMGFAKLSSASHYPREITDRAKQFALAVSCQQRWIEGNVAITPVQVQRRCAVRN